MSQVNLPMTERDRKAFARKIEVVFREATYPEEHEFSTEAGDFVEELSGQDWRELSLDTLVRYAPELPFNSSKLFHYYLPAFLRATVLNPAKMTSFSTVSTMLIPPSESAYEYQQNSFRGLVELFTKEEKMLIAEFLESYGDPYGHMQGIPLPESIERAVAFWRSA